MCITLDGLDPTIRSRTVALHACSFSRPKRVSMRPHKALDAYAYHVRGGHGGVVCTQAGLNLFGHLGCGMMRALIDVCGPARKPSEPSEDSGNPCRRIFYNVETSSTQAGNRDVHHRPPMSTTGRNVHTGVAMFMWGSGCSPVFTMDIWPFSVSIDTPNLDGLVGILWVIVTQAIG